MGKQNVIQPHCYSTIKMNEILIPATAQMNLKNMVSDRRHTQIDYILHDFIYVKCSEKVNLKQNLKNLKTHKTNQWLL